MSSSAATDTRRSARSGVERWLARFDTPLTTYYLLLGVVGALVMIGLVMVLSASMIVSLKEHDASFAIFGKQALFALIGAGALWFAAGRSIGFWRRLAVPLLLISIVLLALVAWTPLGTGFQGNKNWLTIGPLSLQPSELAKLGLALTGAVILERKRPIAGRLRHALIPFVAPLAMIVLVLVMFGHDLGTAMVIAAVVVGVLFAAGVPARWFVAGLAALGALAAAGAQTSENRMARIAIWLNPEQCAPTSELYYGICQQPVHGKYALADGGWWGVGLGASREKWGRLAEPYNDFIFAVIGEELGLIGTFVVLALFGAFALTAMRLVARTDDLFVRLATAGIATWILVQAIVNVGAVIGMLPVIGVPLPFVSSGGSSLVTTMLAVGVLLSFARSEPGCAEAMSSRPNLRQRAVALVRRGPS